MTGPLLEIVEDEGRRRFLASRNGAAPRVLGKPGDLSDIEEVRVVLEWLVLWGRR